MTHASSVTDTLEMKTLIEESLDNDKAENIETIDLRGQTAIADFMIVCTGRSSRQVAALADHIKEKLTAQGLKGIRIEGADQADWVIVDAGDVIVHIFRPEVREFYNIEKMWRMPFPGGDKTPSPLASSTARA